MKTAPCARSLVPSRVDNKQVIGGHADSGRLSVPSHPWRSRILYAFRTNDWLISIHNEPLTGRAICKNRKLVS